MTGWSIRLYVACDELWWAVKLNALWIAFTLAGGVVLGVGPATVAAYTLARRHAMGESFHPWTEFLAAYRREFARGSLLVLPPLAVAAVLFADYQYFSSPGAGVAAARSATAVALVALIVIATYLLPMYVHYDLRLRAYLPKASLFALTRPAASILLLFVLAAVVFAVASLPILALTIAVGGWIQLNTWLCLRFFAENEARLHPKGNP